MADGLGAVTAEGFSPNGIPADISADPVMEPPGGGNFVDAADDTATAARGRHRGRHDRRARASTAREARLPYGLDPASTPVLGSWRSGVQQPAVLRSAWYRLPPREALGAGRAPLLVVSAAGPLRPRRGHRAVGHRRRSGRRQAQAGRCPSPISARPRPGAICARRWPPSPPTATLIRLVATDDDLAPQHWIAVTPPRIPTLSTLQQVVGSQDPVLLDWLVGLAFPCQRPFGHANGVTEVPKWRILPDRFGADANSPVMDNIGGGPLGISELLFRATTVPTYLQDDWFRDWGALQRLALFYPDAAPARLDLRHRDPKRLVEPGTAAPNLERGLRPT